MDPFEKANAYVAAYMSAAQGREVSHPSELAALGHTVLRTVAREDQRLALHITNAQEAMELIGLEMSYLPHSVQAPSDLFLAAQQIRAGLSRGTTVGQGGLVVAQALAVLAECARAFGADSGQTLLLGLETYRQRLQVDDTAGGLANSR